MMPIPMTRLYKDAITRTEAALAAETDPAKVAKLAREWNELQTALDWWKDAEKVWVETGQVQA